MVTINSVCTDLQSVLVGERYLYLISKKWKQG